MPGEPDLPFLVAVAAILASKDEELVRSALGEVRSRWVRWHRRLGELVRLACRPASPGMAASGGSESGIHRLPAERGVFEKLDLVFASMRTATPLQFEADLCAASLRGVLGDPADLGPALARRLSAAALRPARPRARGAGSGAVSRPEFGVQGQPCEPGRAEFRACGGVEPDGG
jgi:hypothetical protein